MNRYPEAAEIAAYMRAHKGPLTSPTLPEWLEKSGAFGRVVCFGYILREIIACGDAERLCGLKRATQEVKGWEDALILRTGFQSYPVKCLYRAYLLALGLLPEETSTGWSVEEPSAGYGAAQNLDYDTHFDRQERLDHFNSLIEVDRGNERAMGLTVANCRCAEATEGSVTLVFELRRTHPNATGALWYALTTPNGRLLDTACAGIMTLGDTSPLPCRVRIPASGERVGKLRLFFRR